MENYCPKCGSRVTFNEKNNKYTCSSCGHTFYELHNFSYVNHHLAHTHTKTCSVCNYTSTQSHVYNIYQSYYSMLSILSDIPGNSDFVDKLIDVLKNARKKGIVK